MRSRTPLWVMGVFLLGLLPASCGPSDQTKEAAIERYGQHLRAHYEDIHDVSMRFHMTDPGIGGRIVLQMVWADGRLESARVLDNETGNDEVAQAFIEAMQTWTIPAIRERQEFVSTLKIVLVGSDSPDFPDTAILTGSVRDGSASPAGGAEITLRSRDPEQEQIEARCNREGVFIRTLIPPGTWDLTVKHPGHEPVEVDGLELAAGQHRVEHVELGD